MLKKTIKYTNFSGVERERTLYFDLTKAELTMLGLGVDGGLDVVLTNLMEAENIPELIQNFEKILLLSYGEKSEDGERFIKGDDISRKFKESPVYDEIFMELITDEKKAADFINAVMPDDIDEYISKLEARRNKSVENQTLKSAT